MLNNICAPPRNGLIDGYVTVVGAVGPACRRVAHRVATMYVYRTRCTRAVCFSFFPRAHTREPAINRSRLLAYRYAESPLQRARCLWRRRRAYLRECGTPVLCCAEHDVWVRPVRSASLPRSIDAHVKNGTLSHGTRNV